MKFWIANRLDQQIERDPEEVARGFIEAVKDGYDLSRCRPSIEFAFRWWLTDREGFNATWRDEDNTILMDGLYEAMTVEERESIWGKLTEGLN